MYVCRAFYVTQEQAPGTPDTLHVYLVLRISRIPYYSASSGLASGLLLLLPPPSPNTTFPLALYAVAVASKWFLWIPPIGFIPLTLVSAVRCSPSHLDVGDMSSAAASSAAASGVESATASPVTSRRPAPSNPGATTAATSASSPGSGTNAPAHARAPNGSSVAAHEAPARRRRKYRHIQAIHAESTPSCLSSDAAEQISFRGFRNLTLIVLGRVASSIPHVKIILSHQLTWAQSPATYA